MKACIYENGKIFTSDKENLYAEAMLTEDGVIRKVGSREDVEKLALRTANGWTFRDAG